MPLRSAHTLQGVASVAAEDTDSRTRRVDVSDTDSVDVEVVVTLDVKAVLLVKTVWLAAVESVRTMVTCVSVEPHARPLLSQ